MICLLLHAVSQTYWWSSGHRRLKAWCKTSASYFHIERPEKYRSTGTVAGWEEHDHRLNEDRQDGGSGASRDSGRWIICWQTSFRRSCCLNFPAHINVVDLASCESSRLYPKRGQPISAYCVIDVVVKAELANVFIHSILNRQRKA